jgi:DNA-directed RNA polymerase specialized sigma24 family protein
MVQLHTFSDWDEAGPGNYWKLDSANQCQKRGLRQKLEENGHSAFKSGCGTTARLRALYIRRQRGLLRRYANLRGILVDPDATATIVKAQLEKADNEATFDRFTELPPEIRQIIFQYYYESLPSIKRASRKYQPPITMAPA